MAATLKDVAEKAGVSIRTTGRALRGDGPVRREVAERVLAAAHALNYVPNAAARNLKQRSSRIVGLITGQTFGSEVGQRRVRLLEEAMRAEGRYTLLGALPSSCGDLDALLREWSGLVKFILFLAWPPTWDPAMLKNYPMRFIFIDCAPDAEEFDRLLTDRASGVEAAVDALIRQGARRIAHVAAGSAVGRASGFEQAVRRAGLPVESFTVRCRALELQDGYRAGDELVKLKADAAFFDTDRMALGFYRYAHEHGLRIPRDILVAGFDNDSAGSFAIPALTTVAHPDHETVKAAVDILTCSEPQRPESMILPTRLLERESSRNQ